MEEVLWSKYCYAGGSVRCMFEFDFKKFKEDFSIHFGKVSDYRLVLSEASGDGHLLSVNHLRGLTLVEGNERVYYFISWYTAERLWYRCREKSAKDEDRFFRDAYAKAKETGNASFEGWVFEFDVEKQLREAEESGQILLAEDRNWTVDALIEYNGPASLFSEVSGYFSKEVNAERFLWMKPKRWSNPAFDFLCFSRPSPQKLKVVVVNASRAKDHDVKLNYVAPLAQTFWLKGWTFQKIEFCFVVPQERYHLFAVGSIRGTLRGYGWPSDNKEELLNKNFITISAIKKQQQHKRSPSLPSHFQALTITII